MSAQTHGFRPLSQHIPILPASARGAVEGLGGGFVKLRMPMDCKIASTPRSLKSAKKKYIYETIPALPEFNCICFASGISDA